MKSARVKSMEDYWTIQPPERSARCQEWVNKILISGWKPNRRIRGMGYYESSEFFGIYIWEFLNVVYPLLSRLWWQRQVENRLRFIEDLKKADKEISEHVDRGSKRCNYM